MKEYKSKYFRIKLENPNRSNEYKIRYYTNQVSINHECLLELFEITGIIYPDMKVGIHLYQNEL